MIAPGEEIKGTPAVDVFAMMEDMSAQVEMMMENIEPMVSGVTEGVLMSLALVEMAKTVYDVPVAVFGQSSQSHGIDFYSGMEAIFADAVLSLAGADNLWGVADMDAATYVDLDYVVLSTEAVRTSRRGSTAEAPMSRTRT